MGRRDLEYGMGGRGGAGSNDSVNLDSCLTVEDHNIRMAELQSLGVDLDTEKLLLLLRYRTFVIANTARAHHVCRVYGTQQRF